MDNLEGEVVDRLNLKENGKPIIGLGSVVGIIPNMIMLTIFVEDARTRWENGDYYSHRNELNKSIINRIMKHNQFKISCESLQRLWEVFVNFIEQYKTMKKELRLNHLAKINEIGRKGNAIASKLRTMFGIPYEYCPNFMIASGKGPKPVNNPNPAIQKDQDNSNSNSNSKGIELNNTQFDSQRTLELINNSNKPEGKKQELRKFVKKAITYKNIINDKTKKLKRDQDTHETKGLKSKKGLKGYRKAYVLTVARRYNRSTNAITALLRNNLEVTHDEIPNVIPAHKHKNNNEKEYIRKSGWVSNIGVEQRDPQDEQDTDTNTIMAHASRRKICTIYNGTLLSCYMQKLDESGHLGLVVGSYIFGTSNRHPRSAGEDCFEVMIICRCMNPNYLTKDRETLRKNPNSGLCEAKIWTRDPELLKWIEKDGKPGDVEKWLALVDAKKAMLLKEQFGSSAFVYCPNSSCDRHTTGFTNKIITDKVYAAYTSEHLHNCVVCIDCDTNWCASCTMSPFHENKPCPGAAYALAKDENGNQLTGKELDEFLNNNKACPKCNIITHKFVGCDHMRCSCGTHWCWRCNGVRSSANPYHHRCPDNLTYTTERDPNDRDDP